MDRINCDNLVDYFNRALTEMEKEQFETHLKTCSECQAELNELIELIGDLPYLSEPVTPPSGMKKRILENVYESSEPQEIQQAVTERPNRPETITAIQQKKSWWTPVLAAALLLSLLGNGYTFMKLNDEQTEKEAAKAVNSVSLKPSETFTGSGQASIYTYEKEINVIVQADQLKALQGDQVYQVWLIKDGKPIPAGSFVPDPTGDGAAVYKIEAAENKDWDTIAITLEPQPGNELPEGQIILSSNL